MKTYQLIGLVGSLILIICGFLPLAYLNDQPITIYPVMDNSIVENLWYWKDISAFAVTFGLTLLLNIYLVVRKYKPGYLISTSLGLAAFLFIYISIWLTSVKSNDFSDLTFSYSLWILLVIAGYVLVYFAGSKIERKKK